MVIQKQIKLALVLAATAFIASATVARAEVEIEHEAPLPLLGATPFAVSVLGAGAAFVLRRRPVKPDQA